MISRKTWWCKLWKAGVRTRLERKNIKKLLDFFFKTGEGEGDGACGVFASLCRKSNVEMNVRSVG